MKNLLLIAAMVLSAVVTSSKSFAAPVADSEPLYTLVSVAVLSQFPDEYPKSGDLDCTPSQQDSQQLTCTFEFGMYRCDDGGPATRWVDVKVNLHNSAALVIEVSKNVQGGCN